MTDAPRCGTPGCEFQPGHEVDHPCGQRGPAPGTPCKFCGAPEPCDACWRPVTHADLKGLAAEAGRDVSLFDSMADLARANAARYRRPQ